MLDLHALTAPIQEAGRREKEKRDRVRCAVETAVREAHGCANEWQSKHLPRLNEARASRMYATSQEPLNCCLPLPVLPQKHNVVATDGSQIVPDRHSGLSSFYLINVGQVVLRYGTGARATLGSDGELELIGDGDSDDEEAERQALREVALIRFRREVEYLAILAQSCVVGAEKSPTVAMVDGSLIAWFFNSKENSGDEDDAAKKEALLSLMEAFRATQSAGVPFVGYVSRPASRDVVNALSTTLCQHSPKTCHRTCEFAGENRPCHAVLAATDAALFGELLRRGERSPVFTSQDQETGHSHVLKKYDADQWICFFYLNVGSEVARVEFPCWVAADETLLNLVHAVCYDQAQKGQGFPVALIEAHEQAVVRQGDREAFVNQLRLAMVRAGANYDGLTRKALSKRHRPL